MKNTIRLGVLGISACLLACQPTPPPPDPAYSAEIEAWRSDREARLTAPDGWLSLVGLEWLEEGENLIGADPNSDVFLQGPGIARNIGSIAVNQGQATLEVAAGTEVKLDGEIVDQPKILLSDSDKDGPNILKIGRLTAYLIKRGDRLAVRVKDPESSTRLDFAGIKNFPLNPALKVEARLEAYSEPRDVTIPTAAGTEDSMVCPGLLNFTVDGRDLTLQPWVTAPEDRSLFIVFTDGTSGKQTYGAGRFLSAELRDDGTATLDFNKSTTPPCGFTPFATCPLAPPENALPVDINAGEQLEEH